MRLIALKNDWKEAYVLIQYLLKNLSASLDEHFILDVVHHNGQNLKYLPESLQANKAIVFTAVSQNPFVLKYASPALQADVEVIAAAEQRREALREQIHQIILRGQSRIVNHPDFHSTFFSERSERENDELSASAEKRARTL